MKMDININNYEVWFIDYYDGNLNIDQQKSLFDFIDMHPELRNEFEQINEIKLISPTEIYQEKELLYKTNINYIKQEDEELIAMLEGDLNPSEELELNNKIKKSVKLQDLQKLIKLTRLNPLINVNYSERHNLKKPLPLFRVQFKDVNWMLRIAAVFLILILGSSIVYLNINDKGSNVQTTFSSQKNNADIVLPKSFENNKNSTLSSINVKVDTSVQAVAPIEDFADVSLPIKLNAAENKNTQSGTNEIEDFNDLNIHNIEPLVPISNPQLELRKSNTLATMTVHNQLPAKEDNYLSIFDGLKVLAKKEVAKEASNENYSDTGLNENADSYKNVKLLDIVGLGIGKLSKNRIKLNDKSNDEGTVTANRLSVGRSKKTKAK
jgi:hypothetical protein